MTLGVLANENFPMPAVRILRANGIDVLAIAESAPGAFDERVMGLARDQGRVLLTFDRDYGELVFSHGHAPPPAIVYLRQEPFPAQRLGEMVLDLLAHADDVAGYFVVVSHRSIRRRPLPQAV